MEKLFHGTFINSVFVLRTFVNRDVDKKGKEFMIDKRTYIQLINLVCALIL